MPSGSLQVTELLWVIQEPISPNRYLANTCLLAFYSAFQMQPQSLDIRCASKAKDLTKRPDLYARIKNKGVQSDSRIWHLKHAACQISESRISQANTKDWRSDSLESFYRCDWDTQSIFVQKPEGLPQLLVLHCSLLVPDTIVPFPLFFCTLILFPLEDYWKFEASSLKDWPKPSFIWLNTLAARSCISHPSFNSPALISMSFSRMLNRPDVVTTLSVGTKGKLVIAYRKYQKIMISGTMESRVYERNDVKQTRPLITCSLSIPTPFPVTKKMTLQPLATCPAMDSRSFPGESMK